MDDIFPVFIGIPDPDEHKVFEWIQKAADAGGRDAWFETGAMYAMGKATEKNGRKAAVYMQKAWNGYRAYSGNRYDYSYVSKFSSWRQNNLCQYTFLFFLLYCKWGTLLFREINHIVKRPK